MNNSFASIYFNTDFGFIIASYTKCISGGPNRIMNPVIHLQTSNDKEKIGNKILEGLEKTRTAKRVASEELEGFKFWQVSGIKGFSTFSKKFSLIDIEKTDGGYELKKVERDLKGAYIYSKNNMVKRLPLSAIACELGELVLQIFEEKVLDIDDLITNFKTAHNNVISYTRPSDQFEDRGDGHTDAYQIYTDENNDNNYIMFVIDNFYEGITEEVIKSQWERWYGKLNDFQYHKIDDEILKIKIYGKTDKEEITSYLYQDGDALMEVTTKIDFINTSTEQQKKIKEEFEKVINSIKIITK